MVKRIVEGIKKSHFFETLLHSRNYFISNLAIKGLGIISLPVMTRLLTPSEYGVLNVFNGYQGIFVSLLSLNCYVSLSRYYFEEQNDFPEFFGTLISFIFSLLFFFFLLSIAFQDNISNFLSLPSNTIVFIVPSVIFYIFNSFFEQIMVPQRQSQKIARRNVFSSYGGFILSVGFILLLEKEKYLGQIYSSFVVGIIFSIYYYFELRPFFRFAFNLKNIKYALIFSLPLLPYSLSGVILVQFDRIMINKCSGYADAGLYSFAYNIGSLISLVYSALVLAWTPDYYKHMNSKNFSQIDSDIEKIFRIILLAALALIFFGKELGMVLAKSSFHSSLAIIPIIVIGNIFYCIYTFNAWHIQYEKKNIYLSILVLISGVVNIFLNLIIIPKFGYLGAAFSSAGSYVILFFLSDFVTKKVLKLHSSPLLMYLKPSLIMMIFVLVYYGLIYFKFNFALGLILKLLFLGSFGSILFFDFFKKVLLSEKPDSV